MYSDQECALLAKFAGDANYQKVTCQMDKIESTQFALRKLAETVEIMRDGILIVKMQKEEATQSEPISRVHCWSKLIAGKDRIPQSAREWDLLEDGRYHNPYEGR